MDLTFWCLIIGALVSGEAFLLPSPENVTVDCDNFETFVYWNYSLSDTLFQVRLKGDTPNTTNVTFKTREHYANLTGRLGNTNIVTYTIRIRATNLTYTSSFSPPVRFAFDKMEKDGKDGIIMCKLDFPPVTMKYTYGELTLRFQNPLHLYENTPALKYLKYNTHPNLKESTLQCQVIDQNNITGEFHCPYERTTCEGNLHISDKKERYCIKLSGQIADRAIVRAAEFCSALNQRGSPPPSGIVCIVSLLLIAAAVVALGAFIFRKKIVKPNQTFPFDWPDLSKQNGQSLPFKMNPPDADNCQPVDLQVFMPRETSEDPLLLFHASGSSSGSTCSRFGIGPDHIPQVNQGWVNLENEEVERVTESTDWETLGGPLSSDYDAPQVMPAGMRPGEGTDGEEEDEGEEETQTDDVSEYLENQEFGNSSGCTSPSDYESRPFGAVDEKQGGSVDMEDEKKSEQSSEDPGPTASKKTLERLEKLEVAPPSDYDSTHCIVVDVRPENWDSLDGEEERDDGEEERDDKGQQIEQKLRKPLSD